MFNYAIEMGSSNTVIYRVGYGVVLNEPTLIAVEHIGDKNVIKGVGFKAKKLMGKTNSKVEVIAPIFEDVIENQTYAKLLLKEFLNKVSSKGLFNKVKAIFCVPCGLTLKERTKYKHLAYSLNISYAETLPSAICALTGMDVDVYDTTSYMVVNIGGGNTDIAVVSNGNIVKGCTINVGGIGIDNAIISYVRDNFNVIISNQVAEQAKKELSSLHPKDKSHLEIDGVDANTLEHKVINLTAKELVPITVTFYNKVVDSINTILNMCNADVIADISRNGIYFCGGLSKVTALEQFMRIKTKMPIYIDIHPENSVINGAGMLLNDPTKLEKLIKEFM